jgi:hypothetical protein
MGAAILNHITNISVLEMNFDSFSHGQITAKLWLCEQLEQHLPDKSDIVILGGWHNVLGFMLQCRNPNAYNSITSVDVDATVKPVADKIMNAWCYDPLTATVHNITSDATDLDYDNSKVYINTSTEHFKTRSWFDLIPDGALIALQSVSITDSAAPWFITQPTATFEDFINLYPLTVNLYAGQKRTQYNEWGYDRFMIIGYK